MESKKITLLSITADEQEGIEIQVAGGDNNKVLLLGLLEQVKYDLLSGKHPDSSSFDSAISGKYDA